MWDSLSRPWQVCVEQAWAAYCAGSLPIGAVVTDSEGRVLAQGRNRIFESVGESNYLYGHRLAHAELNALVSLDHAQVVPEACVLYTTTEPCPLCVGALRMYRIGELRYAARDPLAGSSSVLEATPFFRRRPVKVIGPENPELEFVLMVMFVERVLEFGDEGSLVVLEAFQGAFPLVVQVAKQLFRSGWLRRLREERVRASTLLERLCQLAV